MKVPQRTYSLLDRLLMPLGVVAQSTIFLYSSAATIFAAVFLVYLSRAHSLLIFPGLLVDSFCAGKFSGGFGDWRDPVLIIAGAWSFWISPLFAIWILLGFKFRRNENTMAKGIPAVRKFTIFLLSIPACFSVLATEHSAQTVVITTKPKFEQRGQFVDLVISDTNQNFDIGWSMPPHAPFIPLSLDTNRTYTFTVARKPFQRIMLPELRKVQLDGRTLYDIEVCEIHKAKMEYTKVKIIYGLVEFGPDEPSAETKRQLFPHSREFVLGGCVVTPDSPKTEKIYVCADCRKAYDKWKSEHKRTK